MGDNSKTTINLVVGDALSSRKRSLMPEAHDGRAYQAQADSQSEAVHVRVANHMSMLSLMSPIDKGSLPEH